MLQPIKLLSKPGCKRDGTRMESDYYNDVQWCRFQRGKPRKIGGTIANVNDLPQKVYGIHSFNSAAKQYVHLGAESTLSQRVLTKTGAFSSSADRTPAGLVASADNIWQFDSMFNAGGVNGTILVGHAAPNMDIDSATDTDIFYGIITANTILLASAQDPVSGGILVVGNYLVSFGNGGLVQWSAANDVTVATLDSSNPTQQKIVVGKRIRGAGVPSALLWSLDSLIQMTFNDPLTNLWNFNTLIDDTSILSSRSVIEYDGVFYWLGVDRPLLFNGVVRDLPNDMNLNYFYDNLNFEQRQKVFAIKVPRFGEIWWCYPRGTATECTHAIIYNVRGGFWYDTQLPDLGRTDGLYPRVFNKPLLTGVEETTVGFDLWQHETGVNRVRGTDTQPIPSLFETHEFSLIGLDDKPENKSLRIERAEPDFVQVGDMTIQVRGRANARSPVIDGDSVTFADTPATSQDQITPLKDTFRLLSVKFESNTVDGDYQMGETLGHVEPSDGKILQ